MGLLRVSLLSLSLLWALPSTAYELPALGDASSALISPEQEHRLGRAWLSILRGQVKQLSDPLIKHYVETSVARLAETSQLRDRRLEFILLASPELNAFAAPGGIIGVNAGLILNAQTEAEYISVMAHELAHLSQRHFARGLEAQKKMQVPMMAAMLAGIVAAAAGGGADLTMAAIAGSQAAAFQERQRFSRQNEQEADRIGLANMEKAGFDPRAMPQMFERLTRQYRYDKMPPEFLLTHPITESRIADTRNRAERAAPHGKVDSLTYQLLRARLQLTFEETPGIALKRFRAQLQEQPNNDVARYGLALAQIRAQALKDAQQNLDLLINSAPQNSIYQLAYVDLEISLKHYTAAEQRLKRLLQQQPEYFPAQQVLANFYLQQGRAQDAEDLLNKLVRKRPYDPDIWFQLAEVQGLTNNIIGLHQARAEYFALVGEYQQAYEQLIYAKQRAANNYPLAAKIDARHRALQEEERSIKELLN
ncbi:M48 family metalloprotease [Thiopseudomonas alkaliphila]|uniref:Putative beta-barrel assembly-enhancing protease n=1 Tax=Thiopseudomonas alkaliphila TaxID=1697053 RepID=A0A0K1XC18_9GAMM|nr:M48 family metalloprotease [Thiopseudomonas alkaliphila]AKX58930.1 peptidase M48 [Thiopseudomonas alkaliphila]MDM1715438.1 M48 family metallopeptidase [Thiopseudomonas alkaliphila]